VLVYDDTPDPVSGQIVFFSFNYASVDATDRVSLLENAVVYLMAQESVPTASISGRAMATYQGDHSGIKVTAYPGGDYAYTDVDGTYEIDELYAGTYTVVAEKSNYSTLQESGVLVSEGLETSGVDFLLYPVDEHEYCETLSLAIPDNDPSGAVGYVTVPQGDDTTITDVEVYVDITHGYIGDLVVEVMSPDGVTVRLHNNTGGSGDDIVGWYDAELAVDGPGSLTDFLGRQSAGKWEIRVADTDAGVSGTLNECCVYIWGATLSTDVAEEVGDVPSRYVLGGVSPNPFNPVTTVSYGLPERGHARLSVYNVSGRLVKVLADGVEDAGYHRVTWDGRDDRGVEVSSGVYFCRMEAAEFTASAKMVLLK